MDKTQVPAPHPANLRPGAVVGPWRVVGWAGRGAYGTMYKAVRVGQEQAEPVALKVTLMPGDPRFAQEAELLRRLEHPSIPRLEDAGEWQHASGEVYPFVAMKFLEGLPLYEWTRRNNPSQHTGKYPEIGGPREDDARNWRWEVEVLPAPHVLNPSVEPQLSALCFCACSRCIRRRVAPRSNWLRRWRRWRMAQSSRDSSRSSRQDHCSPG